MVSSSLHLRNHLPVKISALALNTAQQWRSSCPVTSLPKLSPLGSTPSVSSRLGRARVAIRVRVASKRPNVPVPEWSNGQVCKTCFRGFKSLPGLHLLCCVRLAGLGHLTFTQEITGSNPVRSTISWRVNRTGVPDPLAKRCEPQGLGIVSSALRHLIPCYHCRGEALGLTSSKEV